MFETFKTGFRVHAGLMAAVAVLLALSCGCKADPESPGGGTASGIVGIGAQIATRSETDTDPGEGGGGSRDEYDGFDDEQDDLIDVDKLSAYNLSLGSGTILHVSQLTGSQTPFFNDDVTYSYQYIDDYQYDGDDAWMDDNCYNYTPYRQDTPLEWSQIYSLGTYAGGYAMFCMYFPLEDEVMRRKNADNTVTYYVQEDQSTIDNLMRSDILAAYHSTPALFSRIKFRLFHLMTYVRIRLYVPVYRDDLNTGYREGALNSATLNNVTPHFTVEWSAIRSSDTEAPSIAGLKEETLRKMLGDEPLTSTIKMYQHPLPEGRTEHPKVRIKFGDYLSDNYFDQGLGEEEYDDVRVYDFSVIIPVQEKKTIVEDGKEREVDFMETDFLNFYLRTNSGAETRYYFNRAFGANSNNNKLDMTQGNFLYLKLYVPRVGNELIYLGAEVNPWGQKGSEMLLQPTEQNQ